MKWSKCNIAIFIFSIYGLTQIATAKDDVVAPECDAGKLQVCVQELQTASNETAAFPSNEGELNETCRIFHSGVDCIEIYTAKCLPANQRMLYKHMVGGALEAMGDLCNDGPYRQRFLKHASCFHKNKEIETVYGECADHYNKASQQATQITKGRGSVGAKAVLRTLCCSFHRFVACYQDKVTEDCGKDAAEFFAEYTKRASGPVVKEQCSRYTNDSPHCENISSAPYSGENGASLLTSSGTWMLVSLFYFLFLSR